MRILYSKDYLRKSSISNYPYTGYYYQLGLNDIPLDPHSYTEWESNYQSYSNIYPCNTLIRDFNGNRECHISFQINSLDLQNEHNLIYLIALDNTKYSKLEELITKPNEEKFSQVSAIIIIDNYSNFSREDLNIFNLHYIPQCSFSIVNSGNQQVNHYQSNIFNKANLNKASENQMIEFNSGKDILRDLMADQNPVELKGHMTIRRSGVIQL